VPDAEAEERHALGQYRAAHAERADDMMGPTMFGSICVIMMRKSP